MTSVVIKSSSPPQSKTDTVSRISDISGQYWRSRNPLTRFDVDLHLDENNTGVFQFRCRRLERVSVQSTQVLHANIFLQDHGEDCD